MTKQRIMTAVPDFRMTLTKTIYSALHSWPSRTSIYGFCSSRWLLCKNPVLNLSSAKLRNMTTQKEEKKGDKYVTETRDIIKYENKKEALSLTEAPAALLSVIRLH